MLQAIQFVRAALIERKGVTSLEYGVFAALLIATIATGFSSFGTAIGTMFSTLASSLASSMIAPK